MPGPLLAFIGRAGIQLAGSVASQAGEKGVDIVLGSLLAAVGIDTSLDDEQVENLEEINQELKGITRLLEGMQEELEEANASLQKLVSDAVFKNWQTKQLELDDRFDTLAKVYANYRQFTEPTSRGQLPTVSAASIDDLVENVIGNGPDNVEEALHAVHLDITGTTIRDGILLLYSKILIDGLEAQLKARPKTASGQPARATSEDLAAMVNELTAYYTTLAIRQFEAITLIIEARHRRGDGPGIQQRELDEYKSMLRQQEDVFFGVYCDMYIAWQRSVGGASSGVFPNLDTEDEIPFLAFVASERTGFSGVRDFIEREYRDALLSPVQPYLSEIEETFAAFALIGQSVPPTTKARRVVVLATDAPGGMGSAISQVEESVRRCVRLSGSNIEPHVVAHTVPARPDQNEFVSSMLCRLVFEVNENGTYRLENMNHDAREVPGYLGNYQFLSDADLAIRATVNDTDRVAIIRFSPYMQTVKASSARAQVEVKSHGTRSRSGVSST